MIKTSIGERIRLRRKELGLTQKALSAKVGVSHVAISQWEKEETEPTGNNLFSLADALNCTPEFILKGKEENSGNIASPKINDSKGEYPLISWVMAGSWSEALEPYDRRDIDELYETTVACSGGSFWLNVVGDSMTSSSGLSIPEGMIILVDPAIEPINGKLVVAKLLNENEATFKQYIVDAGHHYLKPLNPQYRMIPINGNCRIVGVVVDAKIKKLP
ncbi:LexA family transcriptional regulator [Providencia rettgeri]|nr:LexA family transcriptional regulator [Providencia rettgeri]QPE15891.1 LexA family transcriptional regulator [Providencia rettgeri]